VAATNYAVKLYAVKRNNLPQVKGIIRKFYQARNRVWFLSKFASFRRRRSE
jgi:hypothetical protein